MEKILVVDDEPIIRKVLKEDLKRANYQVDTANDGAEALEKLTSTQYSLTIVDVCMPKMDGIALLGEIEKRKIDTIVIMMTAFGTINDAVTAMKFGAYDYITKPFDTDDLLAKMGQAIKIKEKTASVDTASMENEVHYIIGTSKDTSGIKSKLQKIKNLDSTVLILGESGTGKGVVAHELHNLGTRRELPFIHVNCAVLPPNLIESELFGHEKGAFTGAAEMKKGKIELAGTGTLFLDEISTLAPNLQAKLLTVLQERNMERVGGMRTIPVNARFIAATNINLEEAVRRKEFREDLYYRLNVITIECPPLRFRKEDVRPLAIHFLNKFNKKLHKTVRDISPEVWRIFMNYDWPGNVRELENTLESAMALSAGDVLLTEDLPLRVSVKRDKQACSSRGLLENQEIVAIKEMLDKHHGHRERAAQELGISRRTLQHKLNKFELR